MTIWDDLRECESLYVAANEAALGDSNEGISALHLALDAYREVALTLSETLDLEPDEDEKTYYIKRFYVEDGKAAEIIERGLTLEEAQAHCQREDTHGDGWFDGYDEE